MIYFGNAVADSMFPDNCVIRRTALDVQKAKEIIGNGVLCCFNPSHQATLDALKNKYGINIEIPDNPISIKLERKDKLLVMGVHGLPRLMGRHEYTADEISNAVFRFSIYEIVEIP